MNALDWGIVLKTLPLPDNVSLLGIRSCDILDGNGENAFDCMCEDTLCGSRESVALLHPVGAPSGAFIRRAVKTPPDRAMKQTIRLPKDALLMLR